MKKVLIAILVIIIIIASTIIGKKVIEYINDNIEPIIYYSFNNNPNIPLEENNDIFSNNLTIVWTSNCNGTIKKDGKVVSKNNSYLLSNEGTYEIIVKSPTGKNKMIRTIKIDKTPPQVKVVKSPVGSYNIIFSDITDVDKAILTRIDANTKQLIEEIDLINQGLKEIMEIKEKGYYIFYAIDKYGNSTEEIEFTIE